MKIAFCLFKYFPYGGLQRDFLRIAQACYDRGHEVYVYTTTWQGEIPSHFQLYQLPVTAWQNHTRSKAFIKQLKDKLAASHHDVVIGFNKMPLLDIYYAADICYQTKRLSFLERFFPRHQYWLQLERTVFERGQRTEILLISSQAQAQFQRFYQTENRRIHLLPPGVIRHNTKPEDAESIRKVMRNKLSLSQDCLMVLMVGSGFKTKGLDRSIRAVAALPGELRSKCKLFIAGQDHPVPFKRLAQQLNVAGHIIFLGGRDDVPVLLHAADTLIHPAYHENTGTVLLEALTTGLPVLTTDVCGYASYIIKANAGIVISSPFAQSSLNRGLQQILLSERNFWRLNGLKYSEQNDLYSMPEKAADFIEQIGRRRANLFT